MIKNDAGVILSCFILQIRANKKEQYQCFKCYGFLDELNIMILFIDEYVTVFRRKQKRFKVAAKVCIFLYNTLETTGVCHRLGIIPSDVLGTVFHSGDA